MRTTTDGRTALEDRRIPVQGRLAAAWASFMFFYIYVDYLALYKPGFLDDIRAGVIHDFETGPIFVGTSRPRAVKRRPTHRPPRKSSGARKHCRIASRS